MVKTSEKIFLSLLLFVFLIPAVIANVAPTNPLSEVTGNLNVNQISGNVVAQGNVTYPLGTACTTNAQCNSGNCVDGYCCNSACSGTCNRCDVAGHQGTCTDVNSLCAGTDSSCYCSSGSCTACIGGATCTVSRTCYSPGGAGGGGGGTYAPTITTETETISPLTNGTSGIFNFTNADTLKIKSVSLQVNDTISPAQVTVKESSLPSGANVAIGVDGLVYKYLEITTNVPKDKIKEVKIDFKIEKSWLTANGIDVSSITMKRFVNGDWVSLPTVKTGEDATYVYFEATSPGFSIFAITGTKPAAGTTTTLPSAGTTTTIPTGTTTTTSPPLIPTISGWPSWALPFVLFVVFIVAFLVIRMRMHKHVTHEHPATA